MSHPMIDRQCQKLERRLLTLDRSYDNALSSCDDEASERIGQQIDNVERQLDYLAMEAADPAAHGYL